MENQALDIVENNNVQSFFSNNKILFFAVGGVIAGIAIASALGNERAKQVLQTLTSSLTDVSGKVLDNLTGVKDLLAPLLSKNPVQGV